MISANIITLNEEKNIKECIDSVLKVCSEVIVVDSGSSDKTVEIAQKMGATVVHQPYLGDGFQKNIAAKHCSNKWVLSIDADERLDNELINFISALKLDTADIEAYAFRRRNLIGSRWIKYCGWYPDYCIRLYNSEHTQFAQVKQHAKITSKKVSYIKKDIIHYSYKNIGELFSKPGRNFSSRGAKIMYQQGKRANAFSPVAHGLSALIRKYFFQMGVLGGIDGLSVSLSAGLNSYLKYAKLYEMQNDPKVMEQQDFDKVW
ncbi:MAG: glycosyltransferase family 2 protein [Rhodohalobacter sp.]|uniref:glycosyltransferase family 2 protein n=1 Tax=Rhodohalobacter sp. TaxID=1974210 RepID=UPI0039769CF0